MKDITKFLITANRGGYFWLPLLYQLWLKSVNKKQIIMRVNVYLDNGYFELYDENGMLVTKLRTQRQLIVYIKRNGYVLGDIYRVVKTELV